MSRSSKGLRFCGLHDILLQYDEEHEIEYCATCQKELRAGRA